MRGDEFDVLVHMARWLVFLGDHGYEFGSITGSRPRASTTQTRRALTCEFIAN